MLSICIYRGSIQDVEKAIIKEFAYQSQLELGEETYDAIQKLPTVVVVLISCFALI